MIAMAQQTLTLRIDGEGLVELVDELARVHGALFSRHGDRFKDLQRRIERFLTSASADNGKCWREGLTLQPLAGEAGEGVTYVPVPPPELTQLLRDARALGLTA